MEIGNILLLICIPFGLLFAIVCVVARTTEKPNYEVIIVCLLILMIGGIALYHTVPQFAHKMDLAISMFRR